MSVDRNKKQSTAYSAIMLVVAILTLVIGFTVLQRTTVPLKTHESFVISTKEGREFFLQKEETAEGGFVRVFLCDQKLQMDLMLERSFARPPEKFTLQAQHSAAGPNIDQYMVFVIEIRTDGRILTVAEYWDGARGRNEIRGPANGFQTCRDMEDFDG